MKVFLSWSGEKSHKVALVFRDWFPSVIQCLSPYVSSEDIDKGVRWSTDIAAELEDSTFGILCVTRENLTASWLNFEAGALSKTMDKSFVSPFLFNVKRSEVDGPILQFQSTIFEKEDIKKLLKTLNKACGDEKLTDERLDKAFEVWYPTLEEELNKIHVFEETNDTQNTQNNVNPSNEILEEILELSRLNQKLLRSPDNRYTKEIEQLNTLIAEVQRFSNRKEEFSSKRRKRIHPMFVEEIIHRFSRSDKAFTGIKIGLSLFRNDYPWLYDAGLELIRVLHSKKSESEKSKEIGFFMDLLEFSIEHPMMNEMYGTNEDIYILGREMRHFFKDILKREMV